MNNQKLVDDEACDSRAKCLSLTAIVAGALVALGLSFLLNLFALAIGLSAFKTTPQGITTLAVGGYAGMVIGIIAVMFFTGWVAAYIARAYCATRCHGALYGFIAWCLALVVMILIATQTSEFISANFNALANQDAVVERVIDIDVIQQPRDNREISNKGGMKPASINGVEAMNTFGLSLLLLFSLFFIGAVSSAFGGYCGAKCKEDTCCPH